MNPNDDVTLGELGRLVKEVRDEQRDFRTDVTTRFAGLDGTYIRTEIYDLTIKGLAERLAKLEGNQAWIVRIVVSTVVLGILAGLFTASNAFGSIK